MLLLGCGDQGTSEGAAGTGGTAGAGGMGGDDGGGLLWPCTEQGIRDAIEAGGGPHTFACDGPTIVTTEATVEVDNDVILDGEGDLIVDGDQSHQVFRIARSVAVTLRGMTITGGHAVFAGAGINNEGNLTLEDCRIVENRSDEIAAAIYSIDYVGGGGLEIANSEISRNEGMRGAAIFAGEAVSIRDSTIADNMGGGIDSVALTVRDSTISGNITQFVGGGITNSGGDAVVVRSLITGNEATAGGGVFSSGLLIIFSSTIEGNTADEGGGIYAYDALRSVIGGDLEISGPGLLDVEYSTIANNSARLGGGIYSISLRMTAWNSTFSGNAATEEGGALYIGGTTLGASTTYLTTNTITNNSAPLGSAIRGAGETPTVRFSGNIIDGTCSKTGSAVIWESDGYNLESPGDTCDLILPSDLVDTTPLELSLGPLTDNGGETETHLPMSGSVAIDAIPVAFCNEVLPVSPLLDQRVVARPQDQGCDVGSVEVE